MKNFNDLNTDNLFIVCVTIFLCTVIVTAGVVGVVNPSSCQKVEQTSGY